MSAATPGQALSPDPADFAYHVRATAFNVLTGKMAGDEWSVPRSERDAIARAVVDAVEPLIRADDADQVRLAREDRDQLRKRMLDLAAKFAGQGLGGVAHQLRKIAEPS